MLELLYLDSNALSGFIPKSLSQHSRLASLRLFANSEYDYILRLGHWEDDWSNFLDAIKLISRSFFSRHERTELSGQLPSELGNLKSLDHLSLEYNLLSSSIPPEWNGLTHLAELYVQGKVTAMR